MQMHCMLLACALVECTDVQYMMQHSSSCFSHGQDSARQVRRVCIVTAMVCCYQNSGLPATHHMIHVCVVQTAHTISRTCACRSGTSCWHVCKLLSAQHCTLSDTAQSTITNLPAMQLLLLTATHVVCGAEHAHLVTAT